MSVSVENQGGSYYLNYKPDNAPAGSLGGAGLHRKCDSKEQAEAMKTQIEALESASIQQGTLQAGQGASLDKAA